MAVRRARADERRVRGKQPTQRREVPLDDRIRRGLEARVDDALAADGLVPAREAVLAREDVFERTLRRQRRDHLGVGVAERVEMEGEHLAQRQLALARKRSEKRARSSQKRVRHGYGCTSPNRGLSENVSRSTP